MKQLRSKTPDFPKEIKIQPILYHEIQPVITTEIQPIINRKIQPVVHKEIQPIIHQEIQPVITKEIQPIILNRIQPVIFMENQTNIEEVIQQLERSHEVFKDLKETLKETYKTNEANLFIKRIKKKEEVPQTKKEIQKIDKIVVVPYIMKEEKHLTKREIEEKTEKETKFL